TRNGAEVFRAKGGRRMSRPKKDPSYRLHRQSGQAIVTIPDGLGNRRDILLGKYGTDESWAEYNRVLAEWKANGKRLLQNRAAKNAITINELAWAYWQHAKKSYRRPAGMSNGELHSIRSALRPLKEAYGFTLAREFGPLALKAIRERMVNQVGP